MNNQFKIKFIKKFLMLCMFLPVLAYAKAPKLTRCEQLLAILNTLPHNTNLYRAPMAPTGFASSLGSLNFQAYNGGGYTQGANITAYYGATGSPAPGESLPANVIMSTVPTNNSVPTPRVFIGADGKVGIGNFGPSNASSLNAALVVEGDNITGTAATGAANIMHVGPRTTALNATYVTQQRNSTQVDGDLYVAQNTQTQGFTSYGVFDPLNWIPIRRITTPISINDLSTTRTINSSGKYALYANATAQGNPAIVINASNVVLDLQGFTLTGTGTATSIGIQIQSGVTNVTIRNGTLTSCNLEAIDVASGVDSIFIRDITINACQRNGITFAGGNDIFLENIKAHTVATADASVSVISCVNINSLLCNAITITSSDSANAINGFLLQGVTNGIMRNITINNNTGAAAFTSFNMNNAQNIIFSNCTSIGNTSANNCFGFSNAASSSFLQFYDCSYEFGNGGIITGWQSLQRSNCFNCIHNVNSAASLDIGFSVGTESTIMNCYVSTPISGTGQFYGYRSLADNVAFINNAVRCIHTNGTAGFLFEGGPRIIANNNFSSSVQGLYIDSAASGMACIGTLAQGGLSGMAPGGRQLLAVNSINSAVANNPWLNTTIN